MVRRRGCLTRVLLTLTLSVLLLPATEILAGPNLMAIGDYSAIPAKRAIGRDAFAGNKIVYSFSDPEFDFGRVVVEPAQAKSVVRRDLVVGFNGNGLAIGSRGGGGTSSGQNVEIWLRIQGKLRPGRRYAWEIELDSGSNILGSGLAAIMPVFWADGQQFAAEVDIRTPRQPDDDRIQRLLLPHGEIEIGSFERSSGSAWIVLKPERYGAYFALRRFSFREIETRKEVEGDRAMPIPVAYVPIRDVLEDRIAQVLDEGAKALAEAQDEEHRWVAGDVEASVRLTAQAVAALAELDPESENLLPAMQWLAEQTPQEEQSWATETVARRLYCLARHGGSGDLRRTIHADVQFLVDAQFEDGGWSERSRAEEPGVTPVVQSDNDHTAMVQRALREARFAGVEMETRLWRRVMQYWTRAQAYDGGYRQRHERYGGLGQATTSAYTAYGATGLITSLDMAAGVGGRRCSAYRGSGPQLRAIGGALGWLDQHYTEPFRNLGSSVAKLDAYAEPTALQALGEVSGLSHFNDKDHFAEVARELLRHYNRGSSIFGVRGEGQSWAETPSLLRTARALSVLGRGSAPTVCQRIIAGDEERGWGQYNGDVPHLVRYLGAKRGRPLNWRRTTIQRDVRELVEVPILILDVVGPFDWSDAQWNKIREYCFAGGSVVIDFAKGQEAERGPVVSALRRTFPEYELGTLPGDSPIFSIETELSSPLPVQTLGNGVRYFLFVPGESWSCQWHLYDIKDHEDSFSLMNNLVTYATDGTPLRSSFVPSTYAVRSIPSHSMHGAHFDVGGDVPAHPNLVDAMDRLMQQEYRLAVAETTDPQDETDVLWVSVTGQAALSEPAKARIKKAITGKTSLLIDVVSGREDWDERFRAALEGFEGVKLTKLPRTDPIYTGEIPGTRGFDSVAVNLRRVLHTRFSTTGRCDLYAIFYNGKRVGVYSAYDISSGIGYHYYPGCRGVMPKHARELAMNVFLAAYERKVSEEATR